MNMSKWIYYVTSLSLFVLLAGSGIGQQFPQPMNPPRLVNDFTGMLTPEQGGALEKKLVDFDRSTSTQIVVATVSDLQGLDPSDYAARLFEAWGIGRKGKDNGILILVKPKTEESAGQVFISTGYGVEGAVPDVLAGRIVDGEILPAFREGNYYQGLDRAVDALMGYTRGEFTADEYRGSDESAPSGLLSLLFLLLPFILLVVFAGRRQSRRGYTVTGGGGSSIPPIVGGMLGGMLGGLGGFGGLGGGSRGSGGFGGGFGGFGGGSTGGGGAGGSW
jgi:uncharacterized protein